MTLTPRRFTALAAAFLLLSGCGAAPRMTPAQLQAAALEAQKKKQKLVFDTFEDLEVTKILAEDTDSTPHQLFMVNIDGRAVRVAHNTDVAPHVPLHLHDRVTIKGVYLEEARVLHWTHVNNSGGEGGYILYNGKVYDRK